MRTCRVCNNTTDDFYPNHARCRPCYLKSIRKTKEEYRNKNLKSAYGIDILEYNEILEGQDGRCAICGGTDPKLGAVKNLCVDHCHDTGKVRGILCNSCNRGIGLLGDNIATLQNAINYLQKHQ